MTKTSSPLQIFLKGRLFTMGGSSETSGRFSLPQVQLATSRAGSLCGKERTDLLSPPQQREKQDGGCTPQVPLFIVNQVTAPRDLFFCSKCCVLIVLFNYSHPPASTSQKKKKKGLQMKRELRGGRGGRRRWETLHCFHTAAPGIYLRLSEPREYCLFMCNLILHTVCRLKAARMTCLERGKERLDGVS